MSVPLIPFVPRKPDVDWTPELVALITRLAPGHSASEIAAIVGFPATRCAVLGKLKRLGVRLGASPGPREITTRREKDERHNALNRARRRDQRAAGTPPRAAPRAPTGPDLDATGAVVVAPPATPGRYSLFDLPEHGCKWPLDEVEGTRMFCGGMASVGRPYCDKHAKTALGVSTKPWGGRPRFEGRALT